MKDIQSLLNSINIVKEGIEKIYNKGLIKDCEIRIYFRVVNNIDTNISTTFASINLADCKNIEILKELDRELREKLKDNFEIGFYYSPKIIEEATKLGFDNVYDPAFEKATSLYKENRNSLTVFMNLKKNGKLYLNRNFIDWNFLEISEEYNQEEKEKKEKSLEIEKEIYKYCGVERNKEKYMDIVEDTLGSRNIVKLTDIESFNSLLDALGIDKYDKLTERQEFNLYLIQYEDSYDIFESSDDLLTSAVEQLYNYKIITDKEFLDAHKKYVKEYKL